LVGVLFFTLKGHRQEAEVRQLQQQLAIQRTQIDSVEKTRSASVCLLVATARLTFFGLFYANRTAASAETKEWRSKYTALQQQHVTELAQLEKDLRGRHDETTRATQAKVSSFFFLFFSFFFFSSSSSCIPHFLATATKHDATVALATEAQQTFDTTSKAFEAHLAALQLQRQQQEASAREHIDTISQLRHDNGWCVHSITLPIFIANIKCGIRAQRTRLYGCSGRDCCVAESSH
jgi:hypothetical protein